MSEVSRFRRDLDAYLSALELERGLSPRTVTAYRADLERLGADLARLGGDPSAASAGDLAAHLRRLRTRNLSPRSVNRALAALRGFYAFLVATGRRDDDVVASLVSQRTLRHLPRVLDETEVEALLAVPDPSTPAGLRDRASTEFREKCREFANPGVACKGRCDAKNPKEIRKIRLFVIFAFQSVFNLPV